ncbi:unnamed protein product [Caenorhabditis brenneri]
MDRSNFPLLRLPYLTIILVLETMGFVQLLQLAYVSREMWRIVKDLVKIQGYTLDFYMAEEISFRFILNEKAFAWISVSDAANPPPGVCIPHQPEHSEDGYYRSVNDDCFETYWMNVFKGVKEFYEDITELFHMPLDQIVIAEKETQTIYKEYIPWLNTLTPRSSVIQFMGKTSGLQKYSHSIREINFGSTAQTRKNPERQSSILNFDEVIISHGQSIKVKQILLMEARKIQIHNIKFFPSDYDTLFENLVSGSMPNLVELKLGSTHPRIEDQNLLNFNAQKTDEHIFEILMGSRKCVLELHKDSKLFWLFFKIRKTVKDQT